MDISQFSKEGIEKLLETHERTIQAQHEFEGKILAQNSALREERTRLWQFIGKLQAQIADLQAERWQPTIAGEPGCDDEVTYQRMKDNE